MRTTDVPPRSSSRWWLPWRGVVGVVALGVAASMLFAVGGAGVAADDGRESATELTAPWQGMRRADANSGVATRRGSDDRRVLGSPSGASWAVLTGVVSLVALMVVVVRARALVALRPLVRYGGAITRAPPGLLGVG